MNKIFTLFFILLNFSFAYSNEKSDSLAVLVTQAKTPLEKANLNLEYSWQIKYTDLDQAFSICETSMEVLIDQDDQNGIAVAKSYLGVYYYLDNNMALAIKYLKEAAVLFKDLENSARLCKVYNNLGLAYSSLFDYNTALKYYNKVLEIKEKDPESFDISTNLINIATIYYDQGEYEQCIEANEHALILSLQKNNYSSMAAIYDNLGAAHERIGNFKNAVNYALQALELYQDQIDNPVSEIRTYNNLGATYMNDNQLDVALHYISKAHYLNETANNANQETVILNNFSELYRKKGNLNEATLQGQKALKLGKQIGYTEEVLVSLQTLSAIEKEKENYKDAFDFYLEYIQLSDSLIEISNFQQTQSAIAQNKVAMDQLKMEKDSSAHELVEKKTAVMYRFMLVFMGGLISWIIVFIFRIDLNPMILISLNFINSFSIVSLVLMYLFLRTTLITQLGVHWFFILGLGVIILGLLIHIIASRTLTNRVLND